MSSSNSNLDVMVLHGIHFFSSSISQGTVVDGIEPTSYSLILSSIDGIEEPPSNTSIATNFTRGPSTVTLNVSQPLPRRRLWNYQILALGCREHPISDLQELSKYSKVTKACCSCYGCGRITL